MRYRPRQSGPFNTPSNTPAGIMHLSILVDELRPACTSTSGTDIPIFRNQRAAEHGYD